MDQTMEELQKEIFDQPKPSMDLEWLLDNKRKLQELHDQTNAQLKNNIQQNYSLFIGLSKEIQSLKMEMYQLNNLFQQQQADMSQLLEISITDDSGLATNEKFEAADQAKLRQDELATVQREFAVEFEKFDGMSEKFDVLIGKRDFEEAVNLALKVTDQYLIVQRRLEPSILSDLKLEIDKNIQDLVDAISSELQPSIDRTMRDGPRSISAIRSLSKLNKSSLAARLFLNQRSAFLDLVIKQQKVDTLRTFQYIKRISSIFINTVIDTCKEFRRGFQLDDIVGEFLDNTTTSNTLLISNPYPDTDGYTQSSFNNLTQPVDSNGIEPSYDHRRPTFACMASWTSYEFEHFLTTFKKHVFGSNLSLSFIAECVHNIRIQCPKLRDAAGVDLTFFFDHHLQNDIERVTNENHKKLIDSIKNQPTDELWKPQKFDKPSEINTFLVQMNDLGLKNMRTYIDKDLKLSLTEATVSFAKSFLTTVKDLAKVSIICTVIVMHVQFVL